MYADERIRLRFSMSADMSFILAASKSGCAEKTFALSVEELQYLCRKMIGNCFYSSVYPK
ncbi:E3 ubiquitin-protein ligase mbr2 [Phtheirospermum japonicum]|uniref:E3 ubiquitin-protein ligase mbr2 n=1 Tax=Phtheirospermum japonicum TaxID=374723 RepID=A0A830CKV7_9LAMI|nr:E3 ubiquitin-protein ligase mbr2 [Phtheirospermum japonicum]